MKHLLITAIALLGLYSPLYAAGNADVLQYLENNDRGSVTAAIMTGADCEIKAPLNSANEGDDAVSLDVTTTQAGTLADKLGTQANEIDELVVRGPINDADFTTMWKASFNGRLATINLANATVESGVVPDYAFWHEAEQVKGTDPYNTTITPVALRHITLPQSVKKIGKFAFAYAAALESIEMAEGVEEIDGLAFYRTVNLGDVTLPGGLKKIETAAFQNSAITAVTFPEGLEVLEGAAFYGCLRLKQVVLPSTCLTLEGTTHFELCSHLESVQLPEGLKAIPGEFARECAGLRSINIPSTVETIGTSAFSGCITLEALELHEGLKTIEPYAFRHCAALKQLAFPSTLTTLGESSCEFCTGLEKIYCAALVPPTATPYEMNHFLYPFGDKDSDYAGSTPRDIPVYVPTGTASLYGEDLAWSYFSNFVETDQFPTASAPFVTVDPTGDNAYYDLMGRKVAQPEPGHIYIHNGQKMLLH